MQGKREHMFSRELEIKHNPKLTNRPEEVDKTAEAFNEQILHGVKREDAIHNGDSLNFGSMKFTPELVTEIQIHKDADAEQSYQRSLIRYAKFKHNVEGRKAALRYIKSMSKDRIDIDFTKHLIPVARHPSFMVTSVLVVKTKYASFNIKHEVGIVDGMIYVPRKLPRKLSRYFRAINNKIDVNFFNSEVN